MSSRVKLGERGEDWMVCNEAMDLIRDGSTSLTTLTMESGPSGMHGNNE